MFDNISPTIQEQEQRDREKDNHNTDSEEDLFTCYDICPDIGVQTTSNEQPGTDQRQELIRNRITDSQYRMDVRSLNQKQREIFDHILKTVKTSSDQFFIFISGGAGVEKTKKTKTVYEALIRHYNSQPGANPEQSNTNVCSHSSHMQSSLSNWRSDNSFSFQNTSKSKHKVQATQI